MTENPRILPALPMNKKAIEEFLPHRAPFLLIDEISEYEVGVRIIAHRLITDDDPILKGHFPGNPVLPGVLIIESMAQASAVLGRLTEPTCSTCLLTEISDSRFRRKVVPGDEIRFLVEIVKHRQSFFWFAGEATIGDEPAASAKFSARLV